MAARNFCPFLFCLLLLGPGGPLRAEVLYEREMTEEESRRYFLDTENSAIMDKETPLEDLKKQLGEREWPKEIVKVELLHRTGEEDFWRWKHKSSLLTYHVEIGEPYLRYTYLGEVLYERDLTPEERERYGPGAGSFTPDLGVTAEDLRREYSAKTWHPNTTKVMLKYRTLLGNWPDLSPYIDIDSLGEDLIKKREKEEWVKEARKRFDIGLRSGERYADYVFYNGGPQGLDGYAPFSFEGWGTVGWASWIFRSPKGVLSDTEVFLYEARKGNKIDHHQFLREIIRSKLELEETEHGTVVRVESKSGRSAMYAWLSGETIAIYVKGSGSDPEDLVPLFAERLPSILPEDLDMDKTRWCREEVRFRMQRIERELARPEEEIPRAPGGRRRSTVLGQFGKLADYVYVPFATKKMVWKWKRQTWSKDEEKVLCYRLIAWWREHEEESYWDDNVRRLVVKGQEPE